MAFTNQKSEIRNQKSGFTLVELLVTITIITMLAGMVLGGLRMARTAAREMKTKATIAKLDEIVMRMYAGYAHRRVPIDTTGLEPKDAAQPRLNALLDIIQMEMPDRHDTVESDIAVSQGPRSGIGRPALHMAYEALMPPRFTADSDAANNASAMCLYLLVSIAHPREMEHFGPDEIGRVDIGGNNYRPVFVDAWGNPIRFLRWAPGLTESDIQAGGFDTMAPGFSPAVAFPFVYSAGPDGQYGVNPITGAAADGSRHDNIHNHRLEIR